MKFILESPSVKESGLIEHPGSGLFGE